MRITHVAHPIWRVLSARCKAGLQRLAFFVLSVSHNAVQMTPAYWRHTNTNVSPTDLHLRAHASYPAGNSRGSTATCHLDWDMIVPLQIFPFQYQQIFLPSTLHNLIEPFHINKIRSHGSIHRKKGNGDSKRPWNLRLCKKGYFSKNVGRIKQIDAERQTRLPIDNLGLNLHEPTKT